VNDRLDGGPGRNRHEAGHGDDFIVSANGSIDTVGCGPGRDTVLADANDRLFNCERVSRLRPAG
jgi:hypothetical protein